jgi:hypothetical protein
MLGCRLQDLGRNPTLSKEYDSGYLNQCGVGQDPCEGVDRSQIQETIGKGSD